MAPEVKSLQDLFILSEQWHSETREFLGTVFAYIDEDDRVYYGELRSRSRNITLDEFAAALQPLPDAELFPKLPRDPAGALTVAPDTYTSGKKFFIKRPLISLYRTLRVDGSLPKRLLEEARILECISRRPHPNIITYHGCRVRRGRVTGIVLDNYENNLEEYRGSKVGVIDIEVFMAALVSAVNHLHDLGWAHNDINPANIMINNEGMPVLVDFDSCKEIGKRLDFSRGTEGWMDGNVEDYTTSEKQHDLFALRKIRDWLDQEYEENPVPFYMMPDYEPNEGGAVDEG